MHRLHRALAALLATIALLTGLQVLTATTASAVVGVDNYPWRLDTSRTGDQWNMQKRQCVSFVAFRLAEYGRALPTGSAWGNASQWDNDARAAHALVSRTPKVGAIAQWNEHESAPWYSPGSSRPNGRWTAGSVGHVGFVVGVYPDGSARVEQYNEGGRRSYSVMRVRAPRYLYWRLSA